MKSNNTLLKPIVILLMMVVLFSGTLQAQHRFPQPEFTKGYTYPQKSHKGPSSAIWDYIDVGALLIILIAATFISHKLRKRRYVIILMLVSLTYFGFVRNGCVCSIGAVQPVIVSLINPKIVIPIGYIIFFALPLLFALYWGRVFCSGVCPLGALQDLISIRSIRLPKLISSVLEMLPPVFLTLAIVSAITSSDYLICRLDPFVPLFRLSFGASSIIYSVLWLVTSLFVARPYCRFLCPYGFLLKLVSSVSKHKLTISPDKCVTCRLCEKSCPVDAINVPVNHPGITKQGKSRLKLKFLVIPVLVVAAGFWGYFLAPYLSQLHQDVRLYGYFQNPDEENKLDREIFLATENTIEQLEVRKNRIEEEWVYYATIFGTILGLLLGLKIVLIETKSTSIEYLPAKDRCVHCLRCIEYCPVEHDHRKLRKGQSG